MTAFHRVLDRLGIIQHTFRKDLLFFFVPWLTFFCLELRLCRSHGNGLAGIWGVIGQLILQPQSFLGLPVWRIVGAPPFVIGLTIMIVGQLTLWGNYSGFVVIKKEHQLITHGIYRWTRNPIYLGALIAFISLSVYSASWYGFLATLPIIPIFLFRIRMEETMLGNHFGEKYEQYKKSSKRLIPLVY